MRANALGAHDLHDHLAQFLFALAAAILQHLRASLTQELRRHLGKEIERQPLNIGHATGKRDDFGAVRHREQGARLGLLHPKRSVSVTIKPGVKARARTR